MNVTVISVDGVEPVTLDEAKQQCYIPTSDTDTTMEALLDSIITAARSYGENRTWRTLVDSTLELRMDSFPDGVIELPRPPLVAITSVKYLDSNGTEQTLAASKYTVDTNSTPGRIEPTESWPSTKDVIDAVRIRYKAGYGDDSGSSTAPEDVKIALKMLVKFMYDNRDSFVLLERSGEYHEAPIGTNFLLDMHSNRTP